MKEKKVITASIVLYKEDGDELLKTVDSFLAIPLTKKLFLIDNSPTDRLRNNFNQQDVEYRFNGKNVGFGAGHNTVIKTIKETSEYHLVLNPDVTFNPNVIPTLIKQLEADKELILIAPKILFPNKKHQYSCRRYPTVSELVFRRLGIITQQVKKGEYQDIDLTKPFYPDFLQGCFMLFKTNDFIKINGFDERYFLYMEDVDICRKIDAIGKKKMYYPKEEIVHVLKKGSSRNIKLFFRHFLSILNYFKKWEQV